MENAIYVLELTTEEYGEATTEKRTGKCVYKKLPDDGYQIIYPEENSSIELSVYSDRILMNRKGINAMKLKIEEGVENPAVISTVFGDIKTTVTGISAKSSLGPLGGNLEFSYELAAAITIKLCIMSAENVE